ncbi:hypothetical protein SAMN04488498_106160 [Mesorhizobium albiziae]|uniref:Uncharacterized protein n=2 Tax=Neomesorhizobium albiziae TaxID=335020 RepID=A0A1I3ZIX8_9HYPH|nr:hypothetical protein [Mesorhizobium albiziae]SFK44034.1 hypothetical protein SAMN04488498_106160 [Mesorhizobium albiziae]
MRGQQQIRPDEKRRSDWPRRILVRLDKTNLPFENDYPAVPFADIAKTVSSPKYRQLNTITVSKLFGRRSLAMFVQNEFSGNTLVILSSLPRGYGICPGVAANLAAASEILRSAGALPIPTLFPGFTNPL